MTLARQLTMTAGFAALYLVAAIVGRSTLVPGTSLAMVWPAAGVVAVWFASVGWGRPVYLNAVALLAVASGANFVTGAPAWLALGLGWAALFQALIFGYLLTRWSPHLWGKPDPAAPGLRGLDDMGHMVAAAVVSTVASGLVGPALALSLTTGNWSILGSWVVRNSVSVAAVFPLGLLLMAALRYGGQWTKPEIRTSGLDPALFRRGGSAGEVMLLVSVTTVTAWLSMVANSDLPLPFLLVGTSVWAGARFSPLIATSHSLLVGIGVIGLTLREFGPFSSIANPTTQALVVQAFVTLSIVTSLALTLGRQQSARLTAMLAEAEDAASTQAAMLTTILDSLADGVTVVGDGGRVVLRNPAVDKLLSGIPEDSREVIRPESYGLFHPNGSPVTSAELPYVRALAGEPVSGMEIFVRTAGMPDGRLLEVSATPLPRPTEPMAVMVFHDVTADRRERDELASFAGVVAHDLLNPLTTVEGWSEALAEELREPDGGDADLALRHLVRVQRASRRMRDLINDLLAYTTARDLKISPVSVDLDQLVRDIVRSRTESADRDEQWLTPLITVGRLPAVMAEPVLLRQVVDNLIGNSVKYVAPGVVPQIEVLAHQGDSGMVTVEILDNGIGIPNGQHASVFDTFHRASTEGYRGTGLGLSIVKRIVERHGGLVTASDHPRQRGTLMRFTFPAVTLDSSQNALADPPEPLLAEDSADASLNGLADASVEG